MKMRETDSPSSLFPIRTVATITGINATTLRAWERRYGLIRPVRTKGGHRLYTQEHVDAIQRVTALLEQGIPISQVQHTLNSESHSLQQTTETGTSEPGDQWQAYQRRMLNTVLRFDAAALDAVYNEALALYPVDLVTRQMIVPLLKRLGERWRTTAGLAPAEYDAIAEEHFFGIYLRNKLGARGRANERKSVSL